MYVGAQVISLLSLAMAAVVMDPGCCTTRVILYYVAVVAPVLPRWHRPPATQGCFACARRNYKTFCGSIVACLSLPGRGYGDEGDFAHLDGIIQGWWSEVLMIFSVSPSSLAGLRVR